MNTQLKQLVRHVVLGDCDLVKKFLVSNDVDIDLPMGKERWTALAWAVMEGHESIVRLLLQHGANTEALDLYRRNPLKLAVIKNSVPIIELLLHYGANIERRYPGEETVFITACRLHRYECMDVLISHGACIDAATMDELNALKIAVQSDSMYTVQYLLERGAGFCFPIARANQNIFKFTKSLQMQEFLVRHLRVSNISYML